MPRRSRNRGSGSHAPQSLLILHLDANKLRGDGLHLEKVAEFSGVLSSAAFGAPVLIEDTTSTGHLHETLAALVTARRTFDVIVIVAHSNAEGIRIASDRFVPRAARRGPGFSAAGSAASGRRHRYGEDAIRPLVGPLQRRRSRPLGKRARTSLNPAADLLKLVDTFREERTRGGRRR